MNHDEYLKSSYETADELYEDIKERLLQEGLISDEGLSQKIFQKNYFKEAIGYWKDNFEAYTGRGYTSRLTMWDHVRALIFRYYDVKNIKQMKPEWKDEANELAIKILKLIEKGDKE